MERSQNIILVVVNIQEVPKTEGSNLKMFKINIDRVVLISF